MAKSDYFVDYVTDWASRLRARIYTQWRYSTTMNQWVDEIFGPQAQDLEDAGQSLFSIVSIDDSEGVNLDVLGRIIGQPRTVDSDVTYRTYLKARVLTNKSDGAPEAIYKVLRALLGDDIGLVYVGGGPKQFVIRVVSPITAEQARSAVDFLGDAKEAGARGILEWQESETDALFMFDGTAAQGFDAGVLADAREA